MAILSTYLDQALSTGARIAIPLAVAFGSGIAYKFGSIMADKAARKLFDSSPEGKE
jgi:hypothetical protein